MMKKLNFFQSLSVTGLILSFAAQMMLLLVGKEVKTIWALYPTWIFVFLLGTAFRFFGSNDHHHHD